MQRACGVSGGGDEGIFIPTRLPYSYTSLYTIQPMQHPSAHPLLAQAACRPCRTLTVPTPHRRSPSRHATRTALLNSSDALSCHLDAPLLTKGSTTPYSHTRPKVPGERDGGGGEGGEGGGAVDRSLNPSRYPPAACLAATGAVLHLLRAATHIPRPPHRGVVDVRGRPDFSRFEPSPREAPLEQLWSARGAKTWGGEVFRSSLRRTDVL